MTIESRDQAISSPERECGCPPWVIRCAHFNDHGLQLKRPLTDREQEASPHGDACAVVNGYPVKQGYWNVRRIENGHKCPRCGTTAYRASLALYFGHSEADALEAFYAAGRELLGRLE